MDSENENNGATTSGAGDGHIGAESNARRLSTDSNSSKPSPKMRSNNENNPENDVDVCRVCRCEASPDKPLFYPCVCTGSIKYIHQECLVQWLKYSKKEYCELCKHKFSFAPIYHPDMPKRLPAKDIITGLLKNILKAFKFWLHSTLVAISWMVIVPVTACRIYRCLFAGSVSSLLTLPLDMLSTENIITDILQGGFVVLCSLGAFISLVWLREQILSGGGPEWLEEPVRMNNNRDENNPPAPNEVQLNEPVRGGDAPAADAQNNNDDEPLVENVDQEGGLNELARARPAQPAPMAAQQPININDDNHWNPIEWDRAAEDLTWDRLLGLDGSLLFLEHVFWVISLNTLFILVFAFCPYHLGHYLIYAFNIQTMVVKSHFEGLITTLIGYVLLAIMLVLLYATMFWTSFHRARKIIGLCYIVIKVALLVVFEICVFPLICGVWLDICTLRLFNSTILERLDSFEVSPGTSVFIHWLVGMIYVFYFATFVFLLREVLRPGLLWFLRNLNDPDFNPVQEMIQLPVYRHIRRFLTSVTLFGFSIMLLFLLPIKIIGYLQPHVNLNILPLNISSSSETVSTELSIELLWLHAALPALLEQGHLRSWAKNTIKLWAVSVSYVLGIKSYVMGNDPTPNNQRPNNNNNNNNNGNNNNVNNNNNNENNNLQVQVQPIQNPFQFNIGVAHQALLQNNTPLVNEPFEKPAYFKTRVSILIFLMCVSLLMASMAFIILPVCLGRWLLFKLTDNAKINDLYTIIIGLYTIWFSIRASILIYNWVQIGLFQLYLRFKQRINILIKATVAVLMIFGFLPLLFGTLFQKIIIDPISCNYDQTPVISIWQIWALGVLHLKILTALILTGPQWWLRQVVDRICQDGIRNINLKYMFLQLFYPIVNTLGLCLSVPYVISKSIAPLIISSQHYLILIERRIYPIMLFLFFLIVLFIFQMKQFKRLYERIRNDKYLVGQRLINFERNLAQKEARSTNNASTNNSFDF